MYVRARETAKLQPPQDDFYSTMMIRRSRLPYIFQHMFSAYFRDKQKTREMRY